MNSSVIVCDVIFSLMRIICKSSIYIVKNNIVQQVDGGVAKCAMIFETWFKSQSIFYYFYFQINEFIY
jgi:hypothetical protein